MLRTARILVALLALSLSPSLAFATGDEIEVGVLLPLTGGYAPHGVTEQNALQMAEEAINAEGGVEGRPVRFVVADSASNPETAVKAAGALIEQRRVVALMGGHSSAVAEEIGAMAVARRFPFLITNASAERLSDPFTYTPTGRRLASLQREVRSASALKRPILQTKIALLKAKGITARKSDAPHFSLFRIAPPASDYDAGIASFVKEVVHPRSAVIFYERSLAGGARAARFALTLKQLHIPLHFSLAYDPTASDFCPLLDKIRRVGPDLLIAISNGIDAPLLMRQAAQLKLTPKVIIGAGSGFDDETFIERAGGAGAFLMTSPLWNRLAPWPGAATFAASYHRRFGSFPDYHGAEVYGAARVMAEALRKTKGFTPREITDALRKTDHVTLFGPISFERHGSMIQQNKHVPYLLQWIGGKRKIVWPKELAESPYVYPIDWEKARSADKW